MTFSNAFFDTGEVRLHYAQAGDPAAPLILVLHGFPEYWVAWRSVMERLANDFFVVAPDQRGYNLSDRPQEVESYRTGHLVADIAALADHLSPGRTFVLAGHDWGASVAYAYAFKHPERLARLVVANGVHPVCFQRAIINDPEQRQASQYINWLRETGSEERIAEDGFRRALSMIEKFSACGWMDEEDRRGYIEAWSHPGGMRAMINWYRATPLIVPGPDKPLPDIPLLLLPAAPFAVRVPHLVIWGEKDQALRPSCLDGLDKFAPELTIERVPEAGHWILHEKPDEVAALIRSFAAPAA